MYKKSWCAGLGQEWICLCEGGRNCLKYLKKSGIEKRGRETKIKQKWGASWVKGWGGGGGCSFVIYIYIYISPREIGLGPHL